MEHTRKMVLMPSEALSTLSLQNRHQVAYGPATPIQAARSTDSTLSRLDTEMNDILNSDTYKDEREKWAAYLAVLQRYLHYAGTERAQQHAALMKDKGESALREHQKNNETRATGMNDSVIIESVPNKFRDKAKLLLRRLHDAPSPCFSWNSAGVISVDGKLIKDSNIVDLVNDAMRSRKVPKPVGRKAFARILKKIQTPREFVGNDELWQESIANSTLRPVESDDSSSSSGGNSEGAFSEFHSGRSSKSDHSVQSGSGCYNKKRCITWANLKL